MSLMNERPSSGAFLRSSVHLAQVGCGSSPGRANSFANAPSKTPLRSTKINHPTDLPASSFFSQSPATVGSAAWMGSAALVNATTLAMSSIEILVFKGAIPRCEAQPPSRNNMPISGRAGATQSACVTHRDGFRRNTAMVRKNLASNSDFTAFAAGPRPHELHCAPRSECPESGRLHASPGTHPHAADLPTRISQLIARPAALHRDRHWHRLFRRARDRAAGALFGLRTHRHHDDRPRLRGSLDHAAGNEVLRRPLDPRRTHAI